MATVRVAIARLDDTAMGGVATGGPRDEPGQEDEERDVGEEEGAGDDVFMAHGGLFLFVLGTF
ncbi:hypothetical protein LTR22_008759 [Elasticomyces elasticus]|nr:hypothetical protein LTR22_008759 [Elasticomyces elasticus]KAK4923076.1 hypothetical protein LTR49_009738 [Elasticomyces elasticus]KAK5741576.1 hypothetical protein LTS12_024540 [Elasticomyces elasticus]